MRPPPEALPPPWHVLGLDLGQATEFSALALLEATERRHASPLYAVRHLHRWPLGTAYRAIVADVARLMRRPPLDASLLGDPWQ